MAAHLPFPSIFRYRVRGLSPGTYQVSLTGSAEKLEMSPYIGEIEVTGDVRISDRLHFVLNLKGTGDFVCDRCGKEFQRAVVTQAEAIFASDETSDEITDNLEVFLFDPHTTQEIDLTDIIRDHLLLALPMKNLCSSDCKGSVLEAWEPEESKNKALLRSLYDKLRSEEMNDEPK